MEVVFSDTKLRQAYEDVRRAIRRWGSPAGERYIQRIGTILSVERFDELFTFRSLRLHPLKGDRKEQYAITIHGPWRLIISHDEEESAIVVEEVSKHYGD